MNQFRQLERENDNVFPEDFGTMKVTTCVDLKALNVSRAFSFCFLIRTRGERHLEFVLCNENQFIADNLVYQSTFVPDHRSLHGNHCIRGNKQITLRYKNHRRFGRKFGIYTIDSTDFSCAENKTHASFSVILNTNLLAAVFYSSCPLKKAATRIALKFLVILLVFQVFRKKEKT